MDKPWLRHWNSTIANVNSELLNKYTKPYDYLQPPARKKVPRLEAKLRSLTASLQSGDASVWKKRAKVLLTLRFPELAAGDAYKALQLVDAPDTDSVALILGQALFLANSFLECIDVVDSCTASGPHTRRLLRLRRYALASYAKEQAENLEENVEVQEQPAGGDRCGEVNTSVYPWINTRHLRRRPELISAINVKLSNASNDQCRLGKSTISTGGKDCYGMFAKRRIPTGEIIFIDSSVISAIAGAARRCGGCGGDLPDPFEKKWTCCKNQMLYYCSVDCKAKADLNYHDALCVRSTGNLKPTEAVAGPAVMGTQDEATWKLWVRILALVKQSLSVNPSLYSHPLDVPAFEKLTTTYGVVRRFSLMRHVVWPSQILEGLGVDVYQDHRFDTWVLWTLSLRMEANLTEYTFDTDQGDEGVVLSISDYHTFINHSCEPNVGVLQTDQTGNMLTLFAKRPIRSGDELFISYLDDDSLALEGHAREELLRPWTGGKCKCTRCARELNMVLDDGDDEFDPNSRSDDESVSTTTSCESM